MDFSRKHKQSLSIDFEAVVIPLDNVIQAIVV